MAKKVSNEKAKRATAKKPIASKQVPGTKIALLEGLATLLTPIDEVFPDPLNPRKLKDLGMLINSLTRFGLRRPIIVNKRNNVIEAGHQTRHALIELGATHVPVVWADDDGLTATAFNIADNRTAEKVAEWDQEILGQLMKQLEGDDAINDIGFTQAEIDNIKVEIDSSDMEGMDQMGADGSGESTDDGSEEPAQNDKPKSQFLFIEFTDAGAFESVKVLLEEWIQGRNSIDPEFFHDMVHEYLTEPEQTDSE